MAREWTRRYRLYAKSQGMSPKRVLKRDKQLFPGGHMVGYILWNEGMLNMLDEELRRQLRPARGTYLKATHEIVGYNMTPDQVDEWIAQKLT